MKIAELAAKKPTSEEVEFEIKMAKRHIEKQIAKKISAKVRDEFDTTTGQEVQFQK